MTYLKRRKLLAVLAGMGGLAGCNNDGPAATTEDPSATSTASSTPPESPTPTESPTATRTPTPSPVTAEDLEFVGSVVRQPSDSAPGQVRASLTNRAERTLGLIGGLLIPVSGGVANGPDDALLLYPDQSDAINEYKWTIDGELRTAEDRRSITYEDCWRAPGDGLVRTALADAADIPPDLTAEADFYPLAAAGADCPEGSYTVGQEITVRSTEQTLRTELTVTIDGDGRLAAEGSLTVDTV